MRKENNAIGFFVSGPPLDPSSTPLETERILKIGELFRTYVWGEKGIANHLKLLHHNSYGDDMDLVLFQFYVNPIPYLLQNLKEIEAYRRKEKAIGIPIIVNEENFFSKPDMERYRFLRDSILQKLDLLAEVVKKKKLDTNVELLKSDVKEALDRFVS